MDATAILFILEPGTPMHHGQGKKKLDYVFLEFCRLFSPRTRLVLRRLFFLPLAGIGLAEASARCVACFAFI